MKKTLHTIAKITFQSVLIILLLWIILGLIQSLVAFSLKLGYSESLFFLGVGFCLGLLVFSMLSTFSRVYIFGHECTHWLVAKLFFRKTAGFRFGKGQGSVKVERPNFWIVLAPYFFPLYTVLWLLLIKIYELGFKTDFDPTLLYGGIGVTYAYHVVMTTLALSRNQSDLKIYGQIFSLCLIITLNFSILYIGLASFTNNMRNGYSLLKSSYTFQLKVLNYFVKKVVLF